MKSRVIGGILLMIGGFLGLLNGILLMTTSVTRLGPFNLHHLSSGVTSFLYGFEILGSAVVFLAGRAAIQGDMWGFAIMGSVLAIMTIGPFLISTILGLVALALFISSRGEFETSGGQRRNLMGFNFSFKQVLALLLVTGFIIWVIEPFASLGTWLSGLIWAIVLIPLLVFLSLTISSDKAKKEGKGMLEEGGLTPEEWEEPTDPDDFEGEID